MKIGFKTSQTNVDWGTLKETWQAADELPVFDSGWIFDHFVGLGDGGSCLEGWTTLTALAAATTRLQLGHLVLSNTYRHPAVLARMAATLDIVADGRFVLGLGAGWHEAEHAMYGLPLPPSASASPTSSAVRVLRAIWSSPEGVSSIAAIPPCRRHLRSGAAHARRAEHLARWAEATGHRDRRAARGRLEPQRRRPRRVRRPARHAAPGMRGCRP